MPRMTPAAPDRPLAAELDLDALPPGLAAAWGVVETEGRRGPKPAHTVDEVVAAATALADEEGIAAASLPRVAARIGVSTNALYRYVSSKDELLVLVADRAWGDPPTLSGDDWRVSASQWARLLFEQFVARPWLLDVPRTVPLTPHKAAWLDVLIGALAPTGMGSQQMLNCAYLLDSHARYGADLRRNAPMPAELRRANPDREHAVDAVREFLDAQLRARRLDAVADVMREPMFLADEPPLDGFEFGLDRILDGIAVYVEG
jgi:AcrR family transcriptional regulator